jgi:hypothetical protein
LLGGEEGTFSGVMGHGDGDAAEKLRGAGEDVEVSVSDGIKRSGIDAVAHKGASGTKRGAEVLAMMFSDAPAVQRGNPGQMAVERVRD